MADKIDLPESASGAPEQNAAVNPGGARGRREMVQGMVGLTKFIQGSLFLLAVGTSAEFGGHHSGQPCASHYSYRRASTGSRRAALMAGYIPKTRPTPMETPTASTIAQSGMDDGRLGTAKLISRLMAPPSNTPMTPPAPVSTMASVRNCQMTSRRRAPMALRTPISRVRCVTDISMMFITPTPPTRSPIELIAKIRPATDAVIWRN